MKTKTFLMMLAAAAATMFASCGKDDNPEKMIVGSWNETECLYIFTQGGMCDTTSMFEAGESIDMTYKADKTYTSVYHSTDGDSEDHGTWSVSDGKLTLTDEFGPMTYNIDRLDASVLNLSHNEEGDDEDGHFSLDIVIRMTRK